MSNVAPIMIKDNIVKMKPIKRNSFEGSSISTQASSDEDISISGLVVERTKSD